tara:strand:+ start:63 stop:443 length:381 start_codon:yes stop_codon:yes gene_type:complete
MEDYEVNVLKRNGGWKRLSQKQKEDSFVKNNDEKIKSSNNDLSITIEDEITSKEKNIFADFKDVNAIIDKLKKIEDEKSELITKLSSLEKNFAKKRDLTSEKLNKVKEEYELYEKTVNLIKSLKKV